MHDANHSFEISSSTVIPEEADGGSPPTSEASGLIVAETAAAPETEPPNVTESEHGRDGAKAEASGEPISDHTAEQRAAEEETAETSAAPAVVGASVAEVASPSDAAKSQNDAAAPLREAPRVEPQRATLIPFVAAQPKSSPFDALGRFARDRRFQTGAAAACLALVAIVAGGATLQARSQGESQRLAEAVSALSARLDAIDAAKPREEAAEIRRAVAEARGGLASAHDLAATVAQLNTRLDRVEREQQARLDKLGDHLEHDAAAHNADAQARGADLAARIDKLEKADVTARIDRLEKADLVGRLDKIEKADVTARIDKVEKKMQSAAAQPAAAAPLPPQKEAAAAPAISNEITGSIEKPHPSEPIRGWYLVEMRNGSAIVENRQGVHQIAPGDVLPGAGKVERFEKHGREWVVVTDQGVIPQPDESYAPRVVLRRPMYGPYGGFGPGYGGYD